MRYVRAGDEGCRRARRLLALRVGFVSVLAASGSSGAADWPQWRFDAQRSGESPEELAEDVHPLWVRHYPPVEPAFREERLHFDAGYEPIVAGKLLFFGSSRNDSLTALETETGLERWRFHAEGPVRLAPAAWEGNVYFGSDDGCLYCLRARDGTLAWKFRAVPSRRKLLGNKRLISAWPVRGGPVVHDGRVYFAAGVWSFEGVFVYALDAESGAVAWMNDRCGYVYGPHPHGAEAFGGLTPQGYLLVDRDQLVVPCGPAFPARFDLHRGALVSFELPAAASLPGGWFAMTSRARRRGELVYDSEVSRDRHEGNFRESPGIPGARSTITLAGKEVRFGSAWEGVRGEVHSVLAADGKLFVITRQGSIHCFGPDAAATRVPHDLEPPLLDAPGGSGGEAALEVLRASGVRRGHALVWRLGPGRLVEEIVLRSELHVVGVDPDGDKVAGLRRRLDRAGLHGHRAALLTAAPLEAGFPPYFASLVIVDVPPPEGIPSAEELRGIYHCLRPHGGAAFLRAREDAHAALERLAGEVGLANARVERVGAWSVVRREGPLPGAVNYTGGWRSPDARVRAPLGVLWFDDAVGHFKRSPQPKFVDGLMLSHPKEWLSGGKPPYTLKPAAFTDVYTGRVLAEEEAPQAVRALGSEGVSDPQPDQYRPPYQKDAWKPDPPSPGRRVNPLTGIEEPRTFPKSYGCDGGVDYGYVYTMRSGTAAFYDKRVESGTIHISGPRSGCTNSVVPACGLLNVPYFYEGCTCSYPLPTGLAMVTMPETHEQWCVWGEGSSGKVRRVGINLGAPGDRMTAAGTLWIEHPSAGGPSPRLDVSTVPEAPEWFYRHALWIEGGVGWPWVAASGAKGIERLTLRGFEPGRYTVRLFFSEPDDVRAGERVFDVGLQGSVLLERLDVVAEARGKLRSLVKEFRAVEVDGELDVRLSPVAGAPVLCGVEAVAEGLELGSLPRIEGPRGAWIEAVR